MQSTNSNSASIQEAKMPTSSKGSRSPRRTSASPIMATAIPPGKKTTKGPQPNPSSCSRFCPTVRSNSTTRRWISLPSITNARWGLWRWWVSTDRARAFCWTNFCTSRTTVSAWTNRPKRAHMGFGCGRIRWRIASRITMCFLLVTFCLIVDTEGLASL